MLGLTWAAGSGSTPNATPAFIGGLLLALTGVALCSAQGACARLAERDRRASRTRASRACARSGRALDLRRRDRQRRRQDDGAARDLRSRIRSRHSAWARLDRPRRRARRCQANASKASALAAAGNDLCHGARRSLPRTPAAEILEAVAIAERGRRAALRARCAERILRARRSADRVGRA